MNITIKREISSSGYFYVVYADGLYVTDNYSEVKAVEEAEFLGNGDYSKEYSL